MSNRNEEEFVDRSESNTNADEQSGLSQLQPDSFSRVDSAPLLERKFSRRAFFTRAAAGGGGVIAGGLSMYAIVNNSLEGRPDPELIEIDESSFKPKDQRDIVLSMAYSKELNKKHPERTSQYQRLHNTEFQFEDSSQIMYSKPWDNTKPGYTQKDRALQKAAGTVASQVGFAPYSQTNVAFKLWEQSAVVDEKYEFKDQKDANDSIRSAARVFGAVKCGIAKRDKRWDYDPIYDAVNEKEYSWEEDFPFEPKTVIVMLTPMDYDCMATAPAWTADATVFDSYTEMNILAAKMAAFFHYLGYKAVAGGNDLGNSVAYGIMAGLGEGGRNGALLTPLYGPRVRICKVYTDFEFVEYDVPHTWGITEFCIHCNKCAEACPADAIPIGGEPEFIPSYEHSEKEGYTWNNQVGVKKFYSDAKKCFNFWVDNGGGCGACIASCTFNEPDYWHHKMVMGTMPYTPSILHSLMAESHPAFGYGHTNDPQKPEKFWKTGEGMRTNKNGKNRISTSNKS